MSDDLLRRAARAIRDDWPVAETAPETSMSPETAFHLAVADWLDAEAWLLGQMEPLTDVISLAMQQVSGGKASISLGRKPDGAIDMQACSTEQAAAVARAYLGES